MSDTSQGPGWWQASGREVVSAPTAPEFWSPPPPQVGYAPPPYPGAYRRPYSPGARRPRTVSPSIPGPVDSVAGRSRFVVGRGLGIMARRQVRASGGGRGGGGVALAGLLIGVVGLLGVALLIGFAFAVKSRCRT